MLPYQEGKLLSVLTCEASKPPPNPAAGRHDGLCKQGRDIKLGWCGGGWLLGANSSFALHPHFALVGDDAIKVLGAERKWVLGHEGVNVEGFISHLQPSGRL